MSDVKVGMRLVQSGPLSPVTVTELTDRGFKYRLDGGDFVMHARLGMIALADGHEHYGFDGQALFDPAP